jgi:hypothetical protein
MRGPGLVSARTVLHNLLLRWRRYCCHPACRDARCTGALRAAVVRSLKCQRQRRGSVGCERSEVSSLLYVHAKKRLD